MKVQLGICVFSYSLLVPIDLDYYSTTNKQLQGNKIYKCDLKSVVRKVTKLYNK